MTLSVLSTPDEVQILRADLLASNALPAGDNAQRLLRLWNDLSLLASIPDVLTTGDQNFRLRDPEMGHSPLPWQVTRGPDRRSLVVRDHSGRAIAKRSFPKTMEDTRLHEIVSALMKGIDILNAMTESGADGLE